MASLGQELVFNIPNASQRIFLKQTFTGELIRVPLFLSKGRVPRTKTRDLRQGVEESPKKSLDLRQGFR